jgi:hypothetical protein
MSLSSSRNLYTGDTKLKGPTRSRLLEPYVQLKKADAKKIRQSVYRLRRQTAPGLDVSQRSNGRKGELASDNHQRHDPDAA